MTTRSLALLGLALLAPASAALGQHRYDFNNLMGSDTHPYTLLDGQDNWTEQTFRAANRCGVTATLSHDGTQSLRFQEVGPGYGCDASRINDANWSYPAFAGTEPRAYFQADVQVGYWGGSFGLAHDTNLDGTIRGAQAGERGVRFNIGTQANVQLQLINAAGMSTVVPLSTTGGISGGNWVRVRVVMDLAANGGTGLGQVEVLNITRGWTAFTPVPGLSAVPLALNPTASDASNPTLWDAVWLHFEGATYGLDNIEIGEDLARALPYGTGCGNPAVGLRGVDRPVIGTTASAEVYEIPAGSPAGFLFLGVVQFDPGIDLSPIGMVGCSLYLQSIGAIAFAPSGPTALTSLSIPPLPALAGGDLFLQSAVIAPGANTLGVLATNGLRWTIDLR
ncbi:MAG: hypothetical protein IPM29_30625 [Planctomycetes bacterium]|nr:hypothetical protein [Planctomycetota bacterium]